MRWRWVLPPLFLVTALGRSQVPYWTDISKYPHPIEIAAQIRQESAFNPKAQSPVGALGLGQHMPRNRPWYLRMGWMQAGDDMWDAKTNIKLTSHYMEWLLNRFRQDWHKSRAAYNWGAGNIDRVVKITRKRGIVDTPDRHAWLLLAPKETQGYVDRIENKHIPWVRSHVR